MSPSARPSGCAPATSPQSSRCGCCRGCGRCCSRASPRCRPRPGRRRRPKWCWCASPMSPTCRRRTRRSGCSSRTAAPRRLVRQRAARVARRRLRIGGRRRCHLSPVRAGFAPRAGAEASARPQMIAPAPRRSPRRRCGSRAFRELVALAGEKRDLLTKARAGSRCPAGAHRGRPARSGAGAQRRADAGQRPLAQAGAMDRAALDRDRVQRSRAADAAFAERSRRRTSASAPPNPIRGCRRCWRGFPAPRSSRCASLPPSRRNPMLAVKTPPRAPTATILAISRGSIDG